jgi:hypothetical protein
VYFYLTAVLQPKSTVRGSMICVLRLDGAAICVLRPLRSAPARWVRGSRYKNE